MSSLYNNYFRKQTCSLNLVSTCPSDCNVIPIMSILFRPTLFEFFWFEERRLRKVPFCGRWAQLRRDQVDGALFRCETNLRLMLEQNRKLLAMVDFWILSPKKANKITEPLSKYYEWRVGIGLPQMKLFKIVPKAFLTNAGKNGS